MAEREALLIGSMPFKDEHEAMLIALNKLGTRLFSLPDGEIGEKTELYPNGKRAAWVMTVINRCTEDTANWQVLKAPRRNESGFPADYRSIQRLKPKHPPGELDRYLNLGYDEYFKASYEVFKRLRAERKLEGVKFQVGVPTGLGITFTMLSRLDAIRYANAFNRRIAREVSEIIKLAGEDVIIQVEVPGELALAYMLPGFAVDLPVWSVRSLVRQFPASAQVGVHICLGDLNNEALVKASTLEKMVGFSNRLVKTWPQTRPPVYIHYPLAEASSPPPLEAAYYAPLRRIKLPAGTRFIAGFIHEKLNRDRHVQILKEIEALQGRTVGVACSCGLGRRSPEVAEALLDKMREVISA